MLGLTISGRFTITAITSAPGRAPCVIALPMMDGMGRISGWPLHVCGSNVSTLRTSSAQVSPILNRTDFSRAAPVAGMSGVRATTGEARSAWSAGKPAAASPPAAPRSAGTSWSAARC